LFRTAAPSGYVSYIRCTTSVRPPKAATRCAGKYPYCGARRGRSDAVRTGAGCASGNSTTACKWVHVSGGRDAHLVGLAAPLGVLVDHLEHSYVVSSVRAPLVNKCTVQIIFSRA
jgi:hypothetical protein